MATRACGICGTDVAMWTRGVAGSFVVSDPVVIGHESSGVVRAVGDDVKSLRVGEQCDVRVCEKVCVRAIGDDVKSLRVGEYCDVRVWV